MDGERHTGEVHVPAAEEIGGVAVTGKGVKVDLTGTNAAETAGSEVVVADEIVDGVVVEDYSIEISSLGWD
jgi:hypothetical protein